jgi:hypothetical protein
MKPFWRRRHSAILLLRAEGIRCISGKVQLQGVGIGCAAAASAMLLHSRDNLASPRRIDCGALFARDGAQRGRGLRQRLIIISKGFVVRVLGKDRCISACMNAGSRLTA